MKRIKDKTTFLGLPSEARAIVRILCEAKLRTTDEEMEKRYHDAIQAIGLKWLEHVESQYKPEKRRYRVKVRGEKWVETLAKDEDEAISIVNSGIADHETTEDVEEVK